MKAVAEKEETAAFAKALHDAAVGMAAEIRSADCSLAQKWKMNGFIQDGNTWNTSTPSPSPCNSYLRNLDRAFQESTQQLKE